MKLLSFCLLIFATNSLCCKLYASVELLDILEEESRVESNFGIENDENLLQRLDQLAIVKMDFVAEYLLRALSKRIDEKETSIKSKQSILQDYDQVMTHYREYHLEKQRFGQSKDYLRTSAYRRFLQASFLLFQKMNGNLDKQRKFNPNPLKLAKGLLSQAPNILQLLLSKKERTSFSGFSKFIQLGPALSTAYFPRGIIWNGVEYLEKLKESGSDQVINVIIMNHSDPMYDKIIAAQVLAGLPGSSAILALAQGWRNDWIAKIAIQNQSIISVGERRGVKYSQTTDRVLLALAQGARNLFLFPEGSTGAGFGEIKPLAPGFLSRLLPALLQKYQVRLLAVTTVDTYRMLGSVLKDEVTQVSFGPLIMDQELRSWIPSNESDIATLLRMNWIQKIGVSSTRLFGQFRILELLRYLNSEFGISLSIHSCKALF